MSKPSVFPIKPEDVDRVWAVFSPFINEALQRGLPTHTLEDIRRLVKTTHGVLWGCMDEKNRPAGAAVTIIDQTPQIKIGRLPWLGGYDIDKFLEMGLKALSQWAKLNGCYAVLLYGRKGWEKKLQDYCEIVGCECLLMPDKFLTSRAEPCQAAAADKHPPHK